MQTLDGFNTIVFDFIVDDDMTGIYPVDSHMDDSTYVVAVVPLCTNGIHQFGVTNSHYLISNMSDNAFACYLLDIADLTTISSLIGEGVAQGCTNRMGREMLNVSGEM